MSLKPPISPTEGVGSVFDDRLDILEDGNPHVDTYGADPTGVTDSTVAFNLAKAAAGPGGKILCGDGIYKLTDFSMVGQALSPDGALGTTLEGVGQRTRLIPSTSAAFVVQIDTAYGSCLRNLAINNPNAVANVDGLRIRSDVGVASSQGNMLENVWIRDCTRGIYVFGVTGTPPTDQNDKITYKDVRIDRCTTGYEINTRNAQQQLWLGGSINSCTIAVKMGGGPLTWISGQIQRSTASGGTAFQFTDSSILCLTLRDFICELVDVAFDETASSYWPSKGVIIEGGSVIHARTKFAAIPAGKGMVLSNSILRGASPTQPGGPAMGTLTLTGAASWLRDENGTIEDYVDQGHDDTNVTISALNSRYDKYRTTQPPVYCMSGFLADDIQSITLGTLPPKSLVLRAGINVIEAFNSDGTDMVTIGGTANVDRYAAATDVATIGNKTLTAGSSITPPGLQTTGDVVTAAYTNGGSEPTTGKAIVWMEYTTVGPTPV